MILQSPNLNYKPQRIISLVPSITELLHHLGLEEETVGITKFCVHPQSWYRSKTRVGGTKTLHKKVIDELKPDLIIANKEENVKDQIEELAREYPVWVTDVNCLEDAFKMIDDIGILTGKYSEAATLNKKIIAQFEALQSSITQKFRVLYLIWREPYMTIGSDTFINDMLLYCGFDNTFAHHNRYPALNDSQLITTDYQLLLLPSEPFPFKQKHADELQKMLPDKKVILVDGEMFSWYGSRLLMATEYFKHLIMSNQEFKS